MEQKLLSNSTPPYTISTPLYEGPLDLLLQLIERAELDITKLALAQVTDQFLNHIKALAEQSAEEVSAFLVIAAKLIQIKSEHLLPRLPDKEPGEEDPGVTLVQQLLIYRSYKKIAEFLTQRQKQGYQTFLRVAPAPHFAPKPDISYLTLDDLTSAARIILLAQDRRPELKTVVLPPPITIRQQIRLIVKTLSKRGKASFLAILNKSRSRLEVVVTFLALLELVKLHRINATQSDLFGEIVIEPAASWDDEAANDFELEFGE